MIKACGWRVVVKPYAGPEKVGSILLPEQAKDTNKVAAVVGQVTEVGPLAYVDESKFGQNPEPWCAVGDWVLIGKFAGARFEENGVEFRVLNDDEILATTDNPEALRRAGV